MADVDEAQYALGGLAPEQPAGGRLASAATLVALVADPRRRRALAAHGLAPRVLRAALDLGRSVVDGDARRGGVIEAALGPDPETTRLAAAALLYLSAVGLPAEKAAKAYADGQLATVLEGLLTPSGRAANDTGAASRVRGGGSRRRSRAAPTRERRNHSRGAQGFTIFARGGIERADVGVARRAPRVGAGGEGCGGGDGEGRRESHPRGAPAATERIGTRTRMPIVTRTRVPTKPRRVPMRRRFGSGASSRRLWRSEA